MSEQRCPCGFLRSVRPCPTCDGGSRAPRSPAHGRAISNEQIAEAIHQSGSLYAAANELGITKATIRNRAKQSDLVRAALDARPPRAEPHGLVGFHTCSTCRETKPKSEFYISRAEPRGHQSHCKACDNNKARTQALRGMKRAG